MNCLVDYASGLQRVWIDKVRAMFLLHFIECIVEKDGQRVMVIGKRGSLNAGECPEEEPKGRPGWEDQRQRTGCRAGKVAGVERDQSM